MYAPLTASATYAANDATPYCARTAPARRFRLWGFHSFRIKRERCGGDRLMFREPFTQSIEAQRADLAWMSR